MKLNFERKPLLDSLQALSGVVNSRSTLPILLNVLISAQDNEIFLTATDLEIGTRIRTAGTVIEEGAITVSGRKFLDIVRELDEGNVGFDVSANDRVTLEQGSGSYSLIGLSADEFPQLPDVEGEPFTIDGAVLRSVVHQTMFAASKEEVRYYLNGLYFHFKEDKTVVVATDGRQLALSECGAFDAMFETPEYREGDALVDATTAAGDDGDDRIGFIVPVKAVHEILRTFDEADSIDITVGESQVMFTDENSRLTARLIEGQFPNYEKILPDSESMDGAFVGNRENLIKATQRVALLSNPKNNSISLQMFTNNQELLIASKTPDLGEAHETVLGQLCSTDMRIGMDASLLLAALSHIDDELVTIEYADELKPMILKPHDSTGQLCLVMPMRIEA